jgi:hypothetical protein
MHGTPLDRPPSIITSLHVLLSADVSISSNLLRHSAQQVPDILILLLILEEE